MASSQRFASVPLISLSLGRKSGYRGAGSSRPANPGGGLNYTGSAAPQPGSDAIAPLRKSAASRERPSSRFPQNFPADFCLVRPTHPRKGIWAPPELTPGPLSFSGFLSAYGAPRPRDGVLPGAPPHAPGGLIVIAPYFYLRSDIIEELGTRVLIIGGGIITLV